MQKVVKNQLKKQEQSRSDSDKVTSAILNLLHGDSNINFVIYTMRVICYLCVGTYHEVGKLEIFCKICLQTGPNRQSSILQAMLKCLGDRSVRCVIFIFFLQAVG